MPVKRKRRTELRRRPPQGRVWLLRSAIGFIVLLVVAFFGVSSWLKNYIRSDAFRDFLSQSVSKVLRVNGEFDSFQWNGSSVYSEKFVGQGSSAGPVEHLNSQGIRADVNFGSFRREAWEIENVTINRIGLLLGGDPLTRPPLNLEPTDPNKPFWKRFLPRRVDIQSITIADSEIVVQSKESRLESAGTRLALKPLTGNGGWSLKGSGGQLVADSWPALDLESLHARLGEDQFFITDARFGVHDSATLSMNGELRLTEGSLKLKTHVADLRGDRVLKSDWRQRLLGSIHADIHSLGRYRPPAGLAHHGNVWLKNGVLMALPVLDRIAEYTRTERFKRLVLNEAESAFTLRDGKLELTSIKIQSDGLMQMQGRLTIDTPFQSDAPRPIDGTFQVGVVNDVLKWLPGAQAKVFTREESGLFWTTMRVQGTLDAPVEDLSPRLTTAVVAGTVEAVPDAAVETGKGLLDSAAGILGPNAGGLLKNAGDQLLDTAGGVVKGGLQFVPMLGTKP